MTSWAGKVALVTGVAGQDGVYLARHLGAGGTRVLGTVRPGSDEARRMAPYLGGIEVVELDVRDTDGLSGLVEREEVDEVYNLAARSSVAASWHEPELTHDVNAAAVEHLVESLVAQQARTGRAVRLFQASSAEETVGTTTSPYAMSKAAARHAIEVARRQHGLEASVCTLFNHESPLRPLQFVTRKITHGVAEIERGDRDFLTLGNLEVSRDWGFAGDYVVAMCAALRAERPVDVQIATGRARPLRELLRAAFAAIGITQLEHYVRQDPEFMRPADVPIQVGNPEGARDLLGWTATTTFGDLVAHMVDVDRRRLETGVEHDAAYLSP